MKRMLILLTSVVLLSSGFAAAQPTGTDALPPRSFLRIGATKLRHGDRILCLAYSPDGQILAAGGGNDPLRLWDPKTGELIRTVNEPWVQALAFTRKGAMLVFAGSQKHIRIWNFKQNKETGRLDGHKAAVQALAISPDDDDPADPTPTTIASGSQDGVIRLWNFKARSPHNAFKGGHDGEVTALAFHPTDSNVFASAGCDRMVKLWNVETNQTFLKIDAGCVVLAIAFSPDGKTLYSAGDDNRIRRWDATTGKQSGVFKGHDGAVVSLFAQDDAVVSEALDETIRIWDAKTTLQRKSIARSAGDCDALSITTAGDFLATAGINNVIRIFDAKTGAEVNHAPGAQAGLVGVTLSADQQRLASITSDGQIFVWSAKTGKLHKQWGSQQTGDFSLGLTPDGKRLLTASSTARLWNADTGAAIGSLPIAPGDSVVSLAFSPEGKTVALAMRSNQIDLWDIQEKRLLRNFKYPGVLFAVAWSPDGKKLAAAGGPTIQVWDPHSDTLLQAFDVKKGPAPGFPLIRTLAFGPDGRTLAAGGWDAVIRIYDLNAKDPADLKAQRICEGHLSAVFALAFSADGRSLLSGSFDHTVRLWEAFSGKQIGIYKGHVGAVHAGAALAKDGRSFFSAGTDSAVYGWDVSGLSNNGKLPALTLGPQQLNDAWDVLASEDTPKGHLAMWQCIASAKQAIPYMIQPERLYLLDPERVKKLFRDLDSIHFPTRLAAMRELEGKGRWMEGRYDAAMENPPSLEYKRRVEILKEKLNAKDAKSLAQERFALRRFMLMCEQVGNGDAIEALRKIADRGPEEELRDEARASLQRLKK